MEGERQEVDGRGETRGRWEGRDKRQMGGERQEVDGREDERQQEKLEKKSGGRGGSGPVAREHLE